MNYTPNKFLSIVFHNEYDVTSGDQKLETYLKIDVTALRGGLLKEIQGSNLTVLLAIASFIDGNNKCFPTQRQLAELTGMSLTTINRSINNLLAIRINGRPILERELKGSGQKKSSVYSVMDITPMYEEQNIDPDAVGDTETVAEDPVDTKQDRPKNARDYAHYFADKYKEAYGMAYVVSYKRDLGLIKNKLMKNFDEDQLIAIIDKTIEEYPKRWKNPKYPYPTISMLASWLCNEIVKILLLEEKKDQETEELIQETAEFTNFDYSDFDNL